MDESFEDLLRRYGEICDVYGDRSKQAVTARKVVLNRFLTQADEIATLRRLLAGRVEAHRTDLT